MEEANLKIKVTKIRSWWHARLFQDDRVIDEYRCDDSRDIKWICREMLRWFDKMGGMSKWASAARKRQTMEKFGKTQNVYQQNNIDKKEK